MISPCIVQVFPAQKGAVEHEDCREEKVIKDRKGKKEAMVNIVY